MAWGATLWSALCASAKADVCSLRLSADQSGLHHHYCEPQLSPQLDSCQLSMQRDSCDLLDNGRCNDILGFGMGSTQGDKTHMRRSATSADQHIQRFARF